VPLINTRFDDVVYPVQQWQLPDQVTFPVMVILTLPIGFHEIDTAGGTGGIVERCR